MEAYGPGAKERADRARAIFADLHEGAKEGGILGGGSMTVNGGQRVEEIGFAVRGHSGAIYHVRLTDRDMERLGFKDEPTVAEMRAAILARGLKSLAYFGQRSGRYRIAPVEEAPERVVRDYYDTMTRPVAR